jgi:hypothetical protein
MISLHPSADSFINGETLFESPIASGTLSNGAFVVGLSTRTYNKNEEMQNVILMNE